MPLHQNEAVLVICLKNKWIDHFEMLIDIMPIVEAYITKYRLLGLAACDVGSPAARLYDSKFANVSNAVECPMVLLVLV